MDTCSICLDTIQESKLSYTLSCNHTFHYSCFKAYMLKTKHIFFVDCPNCREMNINVAYPYSDYKQCLHALCNEGVGKVKCPCTTSTGLKCKKKSHLLNYGKCQFHGEILPKDKYEPLCKYVYHLFMCGNRSWETKLYLIDVAKKLLIKFKDDIHTIDDIHRYLLIYISDARKKNISDYYKDKRILYHYYDLELPPQPWIDFCVDRRCLF
jgi:hypothetical protein